MPLTEVPIPQPHGFTVRASLNGGYPEFRIERLLGSRDDAILQAYRDMRDLGGDSRLFIREDGQHEVWTRSYLAHLLQVE